jgi:hypothetical protein
MMLNGVVCPSAACKQGPCCTFSCEKSLHIMLSRYQGPPTHRAKAAPAARPSQARHLWRSLEHGSQQRCALGLCLLDACMGGITEIASYASCNHDGSPVEADLAMHQYTKGTAGEGPINNAAVLTMSL